MIRCRSYRD